MFTFMYTFSTGTLVCIQTGSGLGLKKAWQQTKKEEEEEEEIIIIVIVIEKEMKGGEK